MYNIFFQKRVITICASKSEVSDPNSVFLTAVKNNSYRELILNFEESVNISSLVILTDDVEGAYAKFCSEFTEIDAAGGLVKNEKGEFLMIFRNGVWDLSKGKREEGESHGENAVREVTEECGVESLELLDPICITNHCYHRDGKFILKHTYWFNMRCSSATKLEPQTIEGIEEVRWVGPNELPDYLNNCYPSVVEVFKKALV